MTASTSAYVRVRITFSGGGTLEYRMTEVDYSIFKANWRSPARDWDTFTTEFIDGGRLVPATLHLLPSSVCAITAIHEDEASASIPDSAATASPADALHVTPAPMWGEQARARRAATEQDAGQDPHTEMQE